MSREVITRLAPSPTGQLHIGTARTALFSFLYARKHQGKFILRVEDTDFERSKKEHEENIIDGLHWLGLEWDEMYLQSSRVSVHTELLHSLVSSDKAYISKEPSKANPGTEVEVVRLRNNNSVITFHDEVHGDIQFDTTELGDFVIARNIDEPLFHFAVVVDDEYSKVSHVIRGEDHISNTPRQILIQEALGYERPVYAHIPLILAPDRSKLSKRKGAVAVTEYRDQGYLPQALVNYLVLLGWNSGTEQELYSLDELTAAFSLEGIQKSGAIFDIEKLKWFNKEHIKKLDRAGKLEIVHTALHSLPSWDSFFAKNTRPLDDILERIATAGELREIIEKGEYDFYLTPPTLEKELLMPKKVTDAVLVATHLAEIVRRLETLPQEGFTAEQIKTTIWEYAEKEGRAAVLWPMRTALSGKEKSPDPFLIASVLGKEESVRRLTVAQTVLRVLR